MAVDLTAIAPDARLLVAGVAADLLFGDPVYRLHPVRVIGAAIAAGERALRGVGADGYGGGIVLTLVLAGAAVGVSCGAVAAGAAVAPLAGLLVHAFFLYSFLALGDLVRHVRRVNDDASAGRLGGARAALGNLVGRDTSALDAAGCRRAAIESLSESLTDGFTSALFWYALFGIPGLALFKVASTLDSMVGYRTPRYLRFGWCGARLDDVMNFVPARLTWLLLGIVAAAIPGCSAAKAIRVGWRQHALVPGPNAGWSEAAAAGAIQRRLVGPIWNAGTLVTDVWLGDPVDPPAGSHDDVRRAIVLVVAAGLVAAAFAAAVMTTAGSLLSR